MTWAEIINSILMKTQTRNIIRKKILKYLAINKWMGFLYDGVRKNFGG